MSAARPRPYRHTKLPLFLHDEADRAEELARLDAIEESVRARPMRNARDARMVRRLVKARRHRVTGATLPTY